MLEKGLKGKQVRFLYDLVTVIRECGFCFMPLMPCIGKVKAV